MAIKDTPLSRGGIAAWHARITYMIHMIVATSLALASGATFAATCPFDGGGSDAVNDGLVLTRYALGITGAPMTASTRYASLDPLQVKNNIECVGCALDMNGDGQIDTVDATIIARHLAGFTGSALTNGLNLGVAPSASRPNTAAITSFLVNGCAVGGAINAWTLGGNAFAAPGVIGTTDAQPLTVQSGGNALNAVLPGGNGLRIVNSGVDNAPIVISGSSANQVAAGARGATVAGGGITAGTDPAVNVVAPNRITDAFGTVGGGYGNRAGANGATVNLAVGATVAGGGNNVASGTFSAVVGGGGNTASAHGSFIGGGGYCCANTETVNYPNTVTGRGGSVVGGYENAVAGAASFIGGGYLNRITGTENDAYGVSIVGGSGNTATGNYASIGGGSNNTVSATNATVAGGEGNRALAPYSSVTGGLSASARLFGQTASAAGTFSASPGTAQATQYVLRNRTTDANQNWLYLDGGSLTLSFEPGRAALFDVQVVASAEGTGISASYSFKCHYSVVVGGAAILPVGCSKVVVYEAEASWDVNIAFHPSSVAFGISVIGAAGRNIRWVATVRATEVSTL